MKLSASRKGKLNGFYGKKHQLKTQLYLNALKYKKVQCIETGEIFDSMTHAAKNFMCDHSNISRAVRKGNGVKGFHFRYFKVN